MLSDYIHFVNCVRTFTVYNLLGHHSTSISGTTSSNSGNF